MSAAAAAQAPAAEEESDAAAPVPLPTSVQCSQCSRWRYLVQDTESAQDSNTASVVPLLESGELGDPVPAARWRCVNVPELSHLGPEAACAVPEQVELGQVSDMTSHNVTGPWNYPSLGIPEFDIHLYNEWFHHPDWSLYESVAVLDFGIAVLCTPQMVTWDSNMRLQHPVLCRRSAAECEARLSHLILMGSILTAGGMRPRLKVFDSELRLSGLPVTGAGRGGLDLVPSTPTAAMASENTRRSARISRTKVKSYADTYASDDSMFDSESSDHDGAEDDGAAAEEPTKPPVTTRSGRQVRSANANSSSSSSSASAVAESATPNKKPNQVRARATPRKPKAEDSDEMDLDSDSDSEVGAAAGEDDEEEEEPVYPAEIDQILAQEVQTLSRDELQEMGLLTTTIESPVRIAVARDGSVTTTIQIRVTDTYDPSIENPKKPTALRYLCKDKDRAYIHTQWLTQIEMEELYGPLRTKNAITRWKKRRTRVEATNLEMYGEGVHFDPQYLSVDRIIAHQWIVFDLDVVYDWSQINTRNRTSTTVEIEHCMVKWVNLTYSEATWETPWTVNNDMKIAEFHRYDRRPTLQESQRPVLNDEQAKVYQQRRESGHFYLKSPDYKNKNRLRDYQVEGVNFLVHSWYEDRNVILADEMGLGKTVQMISFLEHLYRVERIRGPFMVVVPLSTLQQWRQELEEWTDMNILVYHDQGCAGFTAKANREVMRKHEWFWDDDGPQQPINAHVMRAYRRKPVKFHVLITTYETLCSDRMELACVNWQLVVIDEGHRLKTKGSKIGEALETLDCDHRILLTGTPIQNTVEELWALLNYLEPHKFNNNQHFMQQFGDLQEANQVSELQKLIAPHILRRKKETVELSIPPKEETIIDVELTTLQKQYYRAIYEKNRQFLLKGTKKGNAPRLMNIEMQLRKCCNHPFMVEGIEEREVGDLEELNQDAYMHHLINASGKMVLLDKLLPKLKADGHKLLIFSQMIRLLDLLEEYLQWKGYKFCRLDGGITGNRRQSQIDSFTADQDRFVFLLSTRAGGVGLNLMAADTVIIFDSDWNPQQDMQAQARVHRIGQTKKVMIYRLITRNTYEAHMFARASKKLGLDHAVLSKLETGNKISPSHSPSADDVDQLLRHGAYGVLDDDETAARRFQESNIDDLLARHAHVITPAADDAEPGKSASGMVFDRMRFESKQSDASIDINDPEFWEKYLPQSETERTQPDVLLRQLTEGSGVANPQAREKFWNDLTTCAERIIDLKSRGEFVEQLDDFITLLLTFRSLTTFKEQWRDTAGQWLEIAEQRTTRRAARRPDGAYTAIRRKRRRTRRGGTDSEDDEEADSDSDEEDAGAAAGDSDSYESDSDSGRSSSSKRRGTARRRGASSRVTESRRRTANSNSSRRGRRRALEMDDDEEAPEDDEELEEEVSGRGRRGRKRGGAGASTRSTAGGARRGRPKANADGDSPKTKRSRGRSTRATFHKTICDVCWQPGRLLQCQGECGQYFHLNCAAKLSYMTQRPAPPSVEDFSDSEASRELQAKLTWDTSVEPSADQIWHCPFCVAREHTCFVCKQVGTSAVEAQVGQTKRILEVLDSGSSFVGMRRRTPGSKKKGSADGEPEDVPDGELVEASAGSAGSVASGSGAAEAEGASADGAAAAAAAAAADPEDAAPSTPRSRKRRAANSEGTTSAPEKVLLSPEEAKRLLDEDKSVRKCTVFSCSCFYHVRCAYQQGASFQWTQDRESFRCSRHYCVKCSKMSGTIARCLHCPRAMHLGCMSEQEVARLTRQDMICDDCQPLLDPERVQQALKIANGRLRPETLVIEELVSKERRHALTTRLNNIRKNLRQELSKQKRDEVKLKVQLERYIAKHPNLGPETNKEDIIRLMREDQAKRRGKRAAAKKRGPGSGEGGRSRKDDGDDGSDSSSEGTDDEAMPGENGSSSSSSGLPVFSANSGTQLVLAPPAKLAGKKRKLPNSGPDKSAAVIPVRSETEEFLALLDTRGPYRLAQERRVNPLFPTPVQFQLDGQPELQRTLQFGGGGPGAQLQGFAEQIRSGRLAVKPIKRRKFAAGAALGSGEPEQRGDGGGGGGSQMVDDEADQ